MASDMEGCLEEEAELCLELECWTVVAAVVVEGVLP